MSGLFTNNITPEQIAHVKKWIAALRSGEYEQTTEVLKNDEGFCCLGVACDISKLSEWGLISEYLDETALLPGAVEKYFGLRDSTGSFWKGENHFSLTGMNDDGMRFEEIADVIEEELASCK